MPSLSLTTMLGIQRELYDLPRGRERFARYLHAMSGGTDDLVLPLPLFNPMGKAHVAEALDALIALDAEAEAIEAVDDATRRLQGIDADFRVGLVVADDLGGGWTNRASVEYNHRFCPDALLKWGWVVVPFWTTETPDRGSIRRAVLEMVYRTMFVQRHSRARTLGALLMQEGLSSAFAGAIDPVLDADDLAYSRTVLAPLRETPTTDWATIVCCLFGDESARTLGLAPLGLSPRAGLAVALADARESGRALETRLIDT